MNRNYYDIMCSAEPKPVNQIRTFDQLRSAVAELGAAQPQLVFKFFFIRSSFKSEFSKDNYEICPPFFK